MTVAVSVLYPPTCDVSYSLEGEHVVLACTAEANPEDVTFTWTRKEELLPGQAESSVSLGLGNDSAGEGRMKEVKSGLFLCLRHVLLSCQQHPGTGLLPSRANWCVMCLVQAHDLSFFQLR